MFTLSQLKRMEDEALQAIRTEGVFGRLVSLRTAAHQTRIVSASRAEINVSLSFTLPTRLREDKGPHSVERAFHVGCLARASTNRGDQISQLSYSVLIGRDAYPSTSIARKFHFDFEPASTRNVAEPKPTFHLQLCGELSKHHEEYGYTENDVAHLLPAWSQPRIPAQPMSLALVMNWLFIEFGCEPAVRDARLNPRWRSIVRDAERSVLKPYFEACSRFLSAGEHAAESFYSKHIYEEN